MFPTHIIGAVADPQNARELLDMTRVALAREVAERAARDAAGAATSTGESVAPTGAVGASAALQASGAPLLSTGVPESASPRTSPERLPVPAGQNP